MIAPLPHLHLPKIRNEVIRSIRWNKYFLNYSDPLIYINDLEYEKYIGISGFNIRSYKIDLTPIKFSSYNSFLDFMCQMTPHVSCIPTKNEKKEFVRDILKEYLKIYPVKENGSYELVFTLAKVCAEKKN
jgi:hypothetical protein